MITVGSTDVSKRLGLGLGLGIEMEDTELEEGEALSYHGEAEDSTIDPDIDLSYIGEKLQHVLGHFQKDFEGGVSAENLGAKFGGYGSFLTPYQLSPSWPHTRSPANVPNYDSPRSPRKLQVEDKKQHSTGRPSVSPLIRSRDASGKAMLVGNSLKSKGYSPSTYAKESCSKAGVSKKSVNLSDQRTLKVRIKVGSENLSTQKNAEIYSGLGLEVSPSSSMDDSPTDSVGHCDNKRPLQDSPTSILQIMMSYPHELLSPLPEHLIHLTEKGKFEGNCENNKQMNKTNIEISGLPVNESLTSRSSQKVREPKKLKSYGNNDVSSMELAKHKKDGDKNNTGSLLKDREIEINSLGCKELVPNALKSPLLPSFQYCNADPVKDVSAAISVPLNAENHCVKDETSRSMEQLGYESTQETCKFEKIGETLYSSGKDSGSRKTNIVSDIAVSPPFDFDHSESNAFEGRKSLPDPIKRYLKGGSIIEEGPRAAPEKSYGAKRKQKSTRSVSSDGGHMEKDEPMLESSLNDKGGKSSHTNNLFLKNEIRGLKEDCEKPADNRYKEFFGDVEFEDDENESMSGVMTSSGRLKDPQFVGKRRANGDHNKSKDKWNDKNYNKLPPGTHRRVASHLSPPSGNGPSSEAPAGVAPLVQEDWVLCDKCQKWRLLPLGTNPKSLPDKWLCRMLNWLPGMNRCSIPEEETTNALRALYHTAAPILASVSENQHSSIHNTAGISIGIGSVDAKYSDIEHQNISVQAPTACGKKNLGATKAANSADLDGSTISSSTRKKNLAKSGKISSLNSEDHSPSLDVYGFRHMQHSGSTVDKYNDTERDKTSYVNNSGKDANLLRVRCKPEADVEGSRAYKRLKSEEPQFDDENWTSDNGGGVPSKVDCGPTSLSNGTSRNGQDKHTKYKDLSFEAKKNKVLGIIAEKNVPGTSGNGLIGSGIFDKDFVRKRKSEEPHGSPIRTCSGRHRPDIDDCVEEMCESDHRKAKKARVSKSGGKNTSGSKTSVVIDRKRNSAKDLHNGQDLNHCQATDYLKRDMGTEQPSVAANSSSSKVSGSHNNKNSGPETKGSPVESVSSSPLRFLNSVSSTRKSFARKDDIHDSGFASTSNARRLSGVEYGGGKDLTEMEKKDRNLMINNHVSDGYNDQQGQSNRYDNSKLSYDKGRVGDATNCNQSQNAGLHVKKAGKEVNLLAKDKAQNIGCNLDKINIKVSDSSLEFLDHGQSNEKSKSRRNKSGEKFPDPSKGEKFISKKDTEETSSEGSKGRSQKRSNRHGQDFIESHDKKHNLQQELDIEKSHMKSNQADVYGSEKSKSLPPLTGGQNENVGTLHLASESQRENGVKDMTVDAFDNGDTLLAPNQTKRAENFSGQPIPIRHPTPNSNKVRDVDAPSPLRKDSSSHTANNALKEAKDLKHLADRLKNSGSTDGIGFYFQAALKFLHAASLFESGSSEATRHYELLKSMNIYSTTAKLCEFCAHEYEKSKDMAAAALAYKCMEVAYLRVVYSSHTSASRDRNELQAALRIGPSGESPSSSASDIDNLNHPATTDKGAAAKVVGGSPQVSGNHIITSRHRAGLLRILNFAEDVNLAMEASRKSRIAFTAATSRLGETLHKDIISSLKKALDFNFQDVDSLLRLVRVAMEAINR